MKKTSKVLFSLLFVFIGVLSLGAGVTLFIINYNLETSPSVEIVDDGTNLYAKTEVNSSYKGYRFKFVSGEQIIIINSDSNSVNLSENKNLKPGEAYKVSVCYLGEIEGNNSKFSQEINFNHYEYLKAPVISVSDDTLSWESVENASYYLLYFGKENMRLEGNVNSVKLSGLSGGEKDIFLVAGASQFFYKQSPKSNTITRTIIHELKPFEDSTIDLHQFEISIVGKELIEKIDVYINGERFESYKINPQKLENGDYNYRIDISAIYVLGASVEVCPASDNPFNIYSGQMTTPRLL